MRIGNVDTMTKWVKASIRTSRIAFKTSKKKKQHLCKIMILPSHTFIVYPICLISNQCFCLFPAGEPLPGGLVPSSRKSEARHAAALPAGLPAPGPGLPTQRSGLPARSTRYKEREPERGGQKQDQNA